jgi:hypothetical protein
MARHIETGWLIRNENTGSRWGVRNGDFVWTINQTEVVRFARAADAIAMCSTLKEHGDCSVKEHQFVES